MKPADIIKIRERERLTQQGMADRLGVHLKTYQQWEWGRRRMGAAARKLFEIVFPAARPSPVKKK
jgi:DNA-binding transcriptional regulator YiaG